MSNLSEFITDVHDEDSSSLNKIGALAGTIADFSGVAGAAVTAVQVVEMLAPAKDPLVVLFNGIKALFEQVNDHIKAADALARYRQIDTSIAKAEAVLDTLKQAVDANSMHTLDAVAQLQTCRQVVEELSQRSAWLAVYVDQIYYNDNWLDPPIFNYPMVEDGELTTMDYGWGILYPSPDADGLVFTYTYVLANWLYAELIFLGTGLLLDPSFAAHYDDVLVSDANFLQTIHDEILRGFKDLDNTPWDLRDWSSGIACMQGVSPILDGTNQTGTRFDYGALEVYSAVTQMAQTQILNQELLVRGLIPSDPRLQRKFQIRLLKQRKLLYAKIGLPVIATLIRKLKRGIAPSATFGDWSLRELCGLAGTQSLRDLQLFILSTPPGEAPANTSSFRALLV